ncbi:hypothetical protein [Tomitella cavernea]|uniref:Helix-turn-helix domain-containing protein n=1 Tax=Tomitella cavernea TaxID=1387982 RepID=A0ABP9D741_9ACTN
MNMSNRPRWTLSEAAQRTGTSRATLLRRIESGQLTGARKEGKSWSIGLDDLLAAGFLPDRPSPPTDAHVDASTDMSTGVHGHVQPPTDAYQRIAQLEHELALARAQRVAAEQVAAERERTIEAQALALRMLEAGKPPPDDAPPDPPAPAPPPPDVSATKQKVLTRVRTVLAKITGKQP